MAEITPEYRIFEERLPGWPQKHGVSYRLLSHVFGVAEMMLTQALAAVLGMTDHEKFDLLVRAYGPKG